MKKIRIIIDIFMLILLIFVYNVEISGVFIHEILGILIWVIFFIHLGLNYRWIKMVTKKFNSGIKKEIKHLYIIDLLLFIDFLIITFTGIGISQYFFTVLNVNNIYFFTNLHKLTSYISILLISIHMIMHFGFIKNTFNKILKNKLKAKIFTIIFIVISILSISLSSVSIKIKEIFLNKIDKHTNNSNYSDTSLKVTKKDNSNTIKESSSSSKYNVSEIEVEKPTLIEYLGSLVCTGCSKKCPLSHPKCGRGETQVRAATADYNEMYS